VVVNSPSSENEEDVIGMAVGERASRYSIAEEIANSLTHGVGAVLSVAGLVVLVVLAAARGSAWHVVGSAVFGTTLVVLYTASAVYHGVQAPRAKAVLRAIDHSAILLLIAGTYTPFTLVNLRGPWGWTLFGVIWGLALLGIAFQLATSGERRGLAIALYVAMGWAVVVATKPLLALVPAGGLLLLLGGGVAYTGGLGFYAWRRLPYHHAVWHVFVLIGSALHFLAVLFYVIPRAGTA
jgi:hemolysin III